MSDEWACIMCSLLNKMENQQCEVCGTIRFDTETREVMRGVELEVNDEEAPEFKDEYNDDRFEAGGDHASDHEFEPEEEDFGSEVEWGEEEEEDFNEKRVREELGGDDDGDDDTEASDHHFSDESGHSSGSNDNRKNRPAKRQKLDGTKPAPKIQTPLSDEDLEIRRKIAFKEVKLHPNRYYYRYGTPGEDRVLGSWTEKEDDIFFQRLKEVGPWVGWGIFGSVIPGRHGMQCQHRYMRLMMDGFIRDNSYSLTERTQDRLKRIVQAHQKFAMTPKKEEPTKWISREEMDEIRKNTALHKWCVCKCENGLKIDKCSACGHEFYSGLKRMDVYNPSFIKNHNLGVPKKRRKDFGFSKSGKRIRSKRTKTSERSGRPPIHTPSISSSASQSSSASARPPPLENEGDETTGQDLSPTCESSSSPPPGPPAPPLHAEQSSSELLSQSSNSAAPPPPPPPPLSTGISSQNSSTTQAQESPQTSEPVPPKDIQIKTEVEAYLSSIGIKIFDKRYLKCCESLEPFPEEEFEGLKKDYLVPKNTYSGNLRRTRGGAHNTAVVEHYPELSNYVLPLREAEQCILKIKLLIYLRLLKAYLAKGVVHEEAPPWLGMPRNSTDILEVINLQSSNKQNGGADVAGKLVAIKVENHHT